MDEDLVLIFAFIIIITTIVGIAVNGVVQKMLDYKRENRSLEAGGAADKAQIGQVNERTAMIEDRLAVLERIATDRGQLLSDEIEQLRISTGDTAENKEKLS